VPLLTRPVKPLPDAIIALDKSSKTGGQQSLKITNPSTGDLTVYTVNGKEIPVETGEIYSITTSIKYRNADCPRSLSRDCRSRRTAG